MESLSRESRESGYLINPSERFWVELQPFLLSQGYQLRRRYNPGWKPSWLENEGQPGHQKRSPIYFEDSIGASAAMLDAVRIRDGKKVVLKRVDPKGEEFDIALFLSLDKMRTDSRNCAVPILEVILIPEDDRYALLVMPHLLPYYVLPFRYLGEFCEMALQLLEGIEFMHEQNITHRDACWGNFMMDHSKVVPRGTHFRQCNTHDGVNHGLTWNTRWSVRPVQYHIIDFGISMRCPVNVDRKDFTSLGEMSQDKTVPELSSTVPYNPFAVDIFQLGNVFNRCIKEYEGFAAFAPLATHMTRKDPKMRPTAQEAVISCKAVIGRLEQSGKLETWVWRLETKTSRGISRTEKLAVLLGTGNPMH